MSGQYKNNKSCSNIFIGWAGGLHLGQSIRKSHWDKAYTKYKACRTLGDSVRYQEQDEKKNQWKDAYSKFKACRAFGDGFRFDLSDESDLDTVKLLDIPAICFSLELGKSTKPDDF